MWGFLRDKLVPWLVQSVLSVAGAHQAVRSGLLFKEAVSITGSLVNPAVSSSLTKDGSTVAGGF